MSGAQAVYRYTGKGDYLPGIPARDLTEADIDAMDKAERKTVDESPIYRAVAEPKTKEAKADPPAKDADKE